jgi:hypothetical protein
MATNVAMELTDTRNHDSSASVVRVRTVGLSYYDRLSLFGFLFGAALGYPLVAFAVNKTVLIPLTARLLIWTAVLAGIVLFVWNRQGIRSVVVEGSGVSFRYPFRSEHSSWKNLTLQLAPQPYAKQRRGIFFSRLVDSEGASDTQEIFVTREQARAILAYPGCLIHDIDPQVRSFLGI